VPRAASWLLRDMVDRSGLAGVDIHEDDVEYITRGVEAPGPPGGMARLLRRGPTSRFEPVAVSEALTDGQLLPIAGGVRVLHTPGHTPGHVSLLHESSGVLITGDVIFNLAWRMTWPVSFVCTNAALNKRSATVLADTSYQVAAFTHGPEIRDRAREQVRDFVRRKGSG